MTAAQVKIKLHEVTIEEESYKHYFLSYPYNKRTLEPIAAKCNIPIPNVENKGDLILFLLVMAGKVERTEN